MENPTASSSVGSSPVSPVLFGFPPTQLTPIVPLVKVGVNSCPSILMTSIDVGVPANSTKEIAEISPMVSKQTWKIISLSGKVTPLIKVSSQPTRSTPGVVLLKLLAPKSAIPNWRTSPIPRIVGSHLKVYWKDKISSKPVTLTSTQACSPQLTLVLEAAKLKALPVVPPVLPPPVLSPASPPPVVGFSQVTATNPFCKFGRRMVPFTSTTSTDNGVSENCTNALPLASVGGVKQISYNTELSAKVRPCKEVSSQPTLNWPAVFKLKLFAFKSPIPNPRTVAVPKRAGSHCMECWKDNKLLNPVVLTFIQTCSPQLAERVCKNILTGSVEGGVPPPVLPPPVFVQVIFIVPSCKVGVIIFPPTSTTSIATGAFENWMGKLPLVVAGTSKHIWYSNWLSATVNPCKEGSSQPTVTWPGVVVLKLGVFKSLIPTWLTLAIPNCAPSQFKVCWKETMFVNPLVVTSRQIWFPQVPLALERLMLKSAGVVPPPVSPPPVSVQVIFIAPFCKVGVMIFPPASTISIATGAFENWMGKLPLVVEGTSKHIWYSTWLSATVNPCKEGSSQPTVNWPGIVVLKLGVFKSLIPTWLTLAVPNCGPSQFKVCWKETILLKPLVVTSKQIWLPQVPLALDRLILKSVGIVTPPPVSPPPVSAQVMVTCPLVKVGVNSVPAAFTTSNAKGVPVNWTREALFSLFPTKQSWNSTCPSDASIPCRLGSSHPICTVPGVAVLKLVAVKLGNPICWTVAVPNKLASQFMEYWKDNISSKPLVVTSTQTCSPQLAVAVEAAKLRAAGGVVVPPVSPQLILIPPFWTAGEIWLPATSTTSITVGELVKAIAINPLEAVAGISKQISYNTKLSVRLMPLSELSSQPILNCPGTVVLKFSIDISGIPKAETWADPSKLAFHERECWKETTSLKPEALTDTQDCIPQSPSSVLTAKSKSWLIVPLPVLQATVTVPLMKSGLTSLPVPSIISTGIGVLVNCTLVEPITSSGTLKQTWKMRWLSAKLTPERALSSHPTRMIPGCVVLKLLLPKSGIPNCPTEAAPSISASHAIVYWKVKILSKSWTWTSKHTCSPQLALADPIDICTVDPWPCNATGLPSIQKSIESNIHW